MDIVYPIDEWWCFLFKLSLYSDQSLWCKCHRSLITIWVDMCTYLICRYVSCQLDRKVRVIVNWNLGWDKALFSLLKCFHTFLYPLPMNFLSEVSVLWVHNRTQNSTIPRNDSSCDSFPGSGAWIIAATLLGSMCSPSTSTWWPNYLILLRKKITLFLLTLAGSYSFHLLSTSSSLSR